MRWYVNAKCEEAALLTSKDPEDEKSSQDVEPEITRLIRRAKRKPQPDVCPKRKT